MKYDETAAETQDEIKLEAALSAALERKNPPLGFAQRVEMRIADQERIAARERSHSGKRGRIWMRLETQFAIAAVLLLAVVLPLGWRLHHQAEVARGEAAKQQVMLALRITGMQLHAIEERTQSIHGVAINAGMHTGKLEGATE
jgi:hypothetical protein